MTFRRLTHSKQCDCPLCVSTYVSTALSLWKKAGGFARPEGGRTVFVRPHWRQGRNHLKNRPNARLALEAALKTIEEKQRAEEERKQLRRPADPKTADRRPVGNHRNH